MLRVPQLPELVAGSEPQQAALHVAPLPRHVALTQRQARSRATRPRHPANDSVAQPSHPSTLHRARTVRLFDWNPAQWSACLVAVSLLAACGGGESPQFVRITQATASPLRITAPTVDQPRSFILRWSVEASSNCLNSNVTASQEGNGYSSGSSVQCDSRNFEQTCTVSASAEDANVRLVSCNRADSGFRAAPGTVLIEVESFYTDDAYPNPVFGDVASLNVTLE